MSEPARSVQSQRTSPPMPPRPRSAQLPELHPNQEVVLDEVGEGEMVENKLVIPDEMMQYLNQVQATGTQNTDNYRASPSPDCRSPVCTNSLHCNLRPPPPTCNFNVQHHPPPPQPPPPHQHHQPPPSAPTCYNPGQPQSCADYPAVVSPYAHCQGARVNHQPPNYYAPACPSPGSAHFSPSHVSDQPMSSPAAGALAPQQVVHSPHQNTAQMSRNCKQQPPPQQQPPPSLPQQQTYFVNYGCQGPPQPQPQPQPPQVVNNCRPMNQPCSPIQACVARPPPSNSRQPLSPHCRAMMPVLSPNPNPVDQCSRPPSIQPAPSNTPEIQQVLSPCSQTSVNSYHCPAVKEQAMRPQYICSHHTCHHPQSQPQANGQDQRYNGFYGNDQQQQQCCLRHHANGSSHTPEIQCRDISQSQQGSPVKLPQGMRQDSYRRTLEYVQQCRNWSGNNANRLMTEGSVSSSTHPIPLPQPLPVSANMIVNDMTSSLSSLLEENRYLQMIQ